MSNHDALLADFKETLSREIPLTNHMGFEGFHYDRDSLGIDARLAPNHNDKGTAFAGALSASANVCGWGLITLLLQSSNRQDYDVVIRDSRLEYLLPVTRDFQVRARFAEDADLPLFFEKLQRKAKARLDVVVEVEEAGQLCFRLTGAYVALKRKQWV